MDAVRSRRRLLLLLLLSLALLRGVVDATGAAICGELWQYSSTAARH
jgi:hypothetical protein